MKYWQCTFKSFKKHPEGDKTVVLCVANKQKGKAAEDAAALLAKPEYEGDNAQYFKKPQLEEISEAQYNELTEGLPSQLEGDSGDSEPAGEPLTADDIKFFACAICKFGKKNEYTEAEEEAAAAAFEGDDDEAVLNTIELVTKYSLECFGEHINDYSDNEIFEVIATIDSAGLKSNQHADVMRQAGSTKCGEFRTAKSKKNLDKVFSESASESASDDLPKQETAKLTVTAPFEVFVRAVENAEKFQSSFLVKIEGSKAGGNIDAVFEKEFDKKVNAISWAVGQAIEYLSIIGKNEGHLQDAANASVVRLANKSGDLEKLSEWFESSIISGGAIDLQTLSVAEEITIEESDDDFDDDFDDIPDFDDDLPDFDDEPEPETEEQEPEKDNDIDDQIDIEDAIETESIERTPDDVQEAAISKFHEHAQCTLSLEEINEITAKIKPGEYFRAYGLDERIYRRSNGISNSELKMFHEDAGALEWARNCPVDEDKIKSLNLGKAVHTMWLEPEKYEQLYLQRPAVGNMPNAGQIAKYDEWVKNGRGDDAPTDTTVEKMDKIREFEQQLADMNGTELTAEQARQVKFMTGSVKAHPAANFLLESMVATEVSIWWVNEKTGVLCKCRVDGIAEIDGKYYPIDVKTTGDFDNFGKSIANFGYHRQDQHYSEAFKIAFGDETPFLFIVVSSSIMCGRYPVKVVEVPKFMKEKGRAELDLDLEDYAKRMKSGDFVEIIEEEIPAYLLKK